MKRRNRRWRTTRIVGIAALSLAVFTLAGCDSETRNLPGSPPPPEIPTPDLESLDPTVRELLHEARQKLEATRADGSATPAELAQSFGEIGKLYHAHSLRDAAAAAYRSAQHYAPEEFRWPYYLGHLYRSFADVPKSQRSVQRALELEPNYLPARLLVAENFLDEDRPAEAEAS